MSIPVIVVNLITPGPVTTNITDYLTMESSLEINDAIEKPHETNTFVSSDVSIKGRDVSSAVKTLLSAIQPQSTDFGIQIWRDAVKQFDGFVLPNTVQFDPQEQSFSFTACGIAKLLDLTDASTLFQRTVTGWTLAAAPSQGGLSIEVIKAGATSCDFVAGDVVALNAAGNQSEAKVLSVTPSQAATDRWFLLMATALPQTFLAGTAVTLVTVYERNVSLQTAVDTLFTTAGLNTPAFSVTFAPSGTVPFATGMSSVGRGGRPIGVSLIGPRGNNTTERVPYLVTEAGQYSQASAPGGSWSSVDATTSRPIDPTPYNQNTNYILYGDRYTVQYDVPAVGSATYSFYAYNYQPNTIPVNCTRWRLYVTCDNVANTATTWNFRVRLDFEKSTTGKPPWNVGVTNVHDTGVLNTSTNLHEYLSVSAFAPTSFGIDLDPLWSTVLFTGITVPGGAGTAAQFDMSTYSGAGLVLAAWSPYRGMPVVTSPGYFAWVTLDSLDGGVPRYQMFTTNNTGTPAFSGSTLTMPVGLAPWTLKQNLGDGYYYALTVDQSGPTMGEVRLLKFTGPSLVAVAGWEPPLILPALSAERDADMMCIGFNRAGGSLLPMIASCGGGLWWIDTTFSQVIPYLDLTDLSCSAALAQLATLVDGYYYVDGTGATYFRTRSANSTQTIAVPGAPSAPQNSAVIDDDGLVSLRTQPIWFKSYRFVEVTNENDSTITGSAGLVAFRTSEGNNLTVKNRYVETVSFALAIANHLYSYLGTQLAFVDIVHEDDGRRFNLGFTFTATLDGVSKTFQIVQSQKNLAAGTVQIQGVQL